jgi:glucose-1-phosphatase
MTGDLNIFREINMQKIKAIGFDQGGIILRVDYHKIISAFTLLGATNAEALYTQQTQVDFIDKFERGEITADEFRKAMRQNLHGLRSNVTDDEIDAAWNAMILDLDPKSFMPIKELLQKGYITFLYSNINELHCKALANAFERDKVAHFYQECFNEIYFSCKIGFNKPYRYSFDYLTRDMTQKYNILAQEILFVDDSRKHIYSDENLGESGALSAGWQGLLVPTNLSPDELRVLIEQKLQSI